MSIFVHTNCQIVGDTAVNHLAWSNTNALLALSTYSIDENDRETNKVVIVNSEGEILSPSSDIESEFEASHFDWHPRDKLLAVGWTDGTVMIIASDLKIKPSIIFASSSQHGSPISLLRWNPSGKRLVSGDKKGLIIVWACDSRGTLSMIRQYRKKGEITSLAFCPFSPRLAEVSAKGKIDPKLSNFSPPFFVGTDKGAIIYADDVGHCTDVHQLSSAIDVMLFFPQKSRLVIITRSLLLTQYYLSEEGKLTRAMQVKLSVSSDIVEKGIKSATWTVPGIFVASTEERVIRFFDLATDENYNISLTNALGGFVDRNDRISVVAFSPADRYLAIGTLAGIVAIWKYVGPIRDLQSTNCSPTSAQDWELIYRLSLGSSIMQMQWWYGRGCIAVVTEDDTIILSETAMNHGVCGGLAVIQRTINELLVLNGNGSETKSINTGIQVRGLSVAPTCFLVWSGKVGKVYRMDSSNQKYESLEQIKTSGTSMVIADSSTIIDEAIFLTEGNSVKILNFTGTQKGIISFSESEGNPVQLDLHGKFLAVATSKGYIKVYDVHTPTKPRQLSGNGVFNEYKSKETIESVDTLILKSVKINSSGTIIGVLCDKVANQNLYFPDSRLFVFDRTKGSITHFDFAAFKRYPKNLIWDEFDDRLLICESIKFRETEHMQKKVEEPNSETVESSSTVSDKDAIEIFTFFVTSEHGILMQDSAAQDTVDSTLIGLSAPNIFYKKSFSIGAAFDESSLSEVVFTRKMRDFIGIDRVTDNVKSSLLDFSFFLTLGKLDEAYRVVKEIDSPMIWENMAQMCVKTKRLDVAEVCLGNMGHARGAAAVRESKRENNLEVSIGVLAIQLGLLDDAARMFKEANRHDLLNQLYQAAGLWGKAIEVAESNDRIHLKTTHFQYAKYLENLSKIDEAIEHFQVADTARTEVPRLLFQLGRIEELNEYVMHSDDSSLSKWWASYLESIDRLDKAKRYYAKAKDYLSLVRIYCFQGDFQKAVDIITESNDRASAYHFARQMENQGEFQEAIRFYALSGCYNHSIRLARAYNLDSELMRFAVKSTQALMIECAQHFEAKSEFDKAIQLYHKGGDIPRALELCFRIGEDPKHPHAAVAFDLLNAIAQDLGVESSPQTLARCADFLVQHQQYNKAIELYVMAKRYLAAIEMCTIQRVSLTEEMVESLTPPEDLDSVERKDILKSLAKALKKQGAFTLASKKYTQAGDRVRAIKCLVRGGDTKAVIQFANISRNNEIYTLAANYLQQMDWRENVEIMKAIITFYTRAKAFVQLAGFYEGCAQVEIDEYRDYEKALGALNEAIKCLSKDNSRTAIDMLKSLEKRILIIEKFIEAKFAKNNPNLTVTICEALLQDPLVEEAIRLGDCLALLIETFHQKGNFPEAYHYLQELQERFNSVQTYLDDKLIRDLEQKMGIKQVERERMNERPSRNESTHHGESKGDIEDEIEEEIDEVSFLSRLEVTIFSILQDLGGGYEGKSQHADRKRW